jgi:hypothetical protein
MTFKEILDKASENSIQVWHLVAANEVACYMDDKELELNEEEFEQVSHFVYDWIINTDATPYEVVNALMDVIQNNDRYSFSEIYRDWDELTEEINDRF